MAYSKEQKDKVFNIIVTEIAKGRSLTAVLKDSNLGVKMPADNTFDKWVAEDPAKLTEYALAREKRAERIFEEILEIADKQGEDVIELEDGTTMVNHNIVHRNKLQIDARKWMLGKMQPKKYGDKLDVTTDGEKITPLTAVNITRIKK